MFGTTRGTLVPAGKWLLACTFALTVAIPIAAKADDGLVDARTLPRLEGAVEDTARTRSNKLVYVVPTAFANTSDAVRTLLAASGWMQYTQPLEEAGTSLLFKKDRQGLYVSFTQRPSRPDQSTVYYDASRIGTNLPFPDGASDIVFDENRPYLSCVTTTTVNATLDLFARELAASGWSSLTAADAAAHWPNARLDPVIAGGVRAYYSHDNRGGGYPQPPIVVSLQRRADGKTGVDIRVAPFALPQQLELAKEEIGLPAPNHIKSFGSTGSADSIQRKLGGTVIAEIPVVLAFFRRELAARDWKEEANGAVVTPDEVSLNFSSQDQTATLKLGQKYDLTTVNLVPPGQGIRAGGARQGEERRRCKIPQRCRVCRKTDDGRG
jgi:hypothetical protein